MIELAVDDLRVGKCGIHETDAKSMIELQLQHDAAGRKRMATDLSLFANTNSARAEADNTQH